MLFSNSGQAHDLGHTRDWVVIVYEDGQDKGQATVVTECDGPYTGCRVVRGRERECARLFDRQPPSTVQAWVSNVLARLE